MELQQLWAVIARRWWLVLLPAVVALLLSLSALRAMLAPPLVYTVTIRLTASQIPTDDTAKTFQDQSYIPWLASEYAVSNLARWMGTESFAREMSDKLSQQGKPIDVGAIRGAIIPDSVRSILSMTLTWPAPDEIKLLAQAAIDVLRERNGAYFSQFGAKPAAVKPLDAIVVMPAPTPVGTRLGPLVRVMIGLVAGLALAFLAEYLDPTLRNRAEIETLGLPVIAEIPRY